MQKLLLAMATTMVFAGCFDEGVDLGNVDFDRKALLTNLADNLILPSYASLESATETLGRSLDSLVSRPDSQSLDSARASLRAAWGSWQAVSTFEFGPAANVSLRQSVNIFPVKTLHIETNIDSGNYNLEAASNFIAKGFPALDYLLHGHPTDTILALLRDSVEGDARKTYLQAVSDEIEAKVLSVHQSWRADGGNYRDHFISSMGTDIGSSLGQLVNQLNFDFELLKNAKIGIPLGKRTGKARPNEVEAYYGGYSMELARAQLYAHENIYRGRSAAGVDGPGLDDYLVAIGNRYKAGTLPDTIASRFAQIKDAIEDVPDPLSVSIGTQTEKVSALYQEIQKTVLYLKTDMPSALGVSITYLDNDGD